VSTPEIDPKERRRITLQLPRHLVEGIDRLRVEWGLRSRGDTVERLLGELLTEELPDDESLLHQDGSIPGDNAGFFDESGALVLVAQQGTGGLGLDFVETRHGDGPPRSRDSAGIDLPGFVRRKSDQLRQSMNVSDAQARAEREMFSLVDADAVDGALDAVQRHWHELYGQSANEAVLEAAMVWLSSDIWPNSDQSDGRPFTWTLASSIALQLAPSWSDAAPTFARVIVLAGLLEDPYSSSTLSLRVPTLIRRFVHRFRKRQRGMSFETLEHTMSLHGALKLLNLPTAPGHRLTLKDIREAYREQAMLHHPDSGGSAESMRRLNEAYQMLKELYRSR
jgi:Arc/MetJ-type ribon-helix-helix transcriptional regulator